MKLWMLRPLEQNDYDPWKPWYDKAFGFVVRAKTEKEARKIAHDNAGDENVRWDTSDRIKTHQPWLDKAYSACEELISDGVEGLLMKDFHSA